MRRKAPISLSQRFPDVDPMALRLLQRLIAFDPKDRPSAEEVIFPVAKYSIFFSPIKEGVCIDINTSYLYRHWQILTSTGWQMWRMSRQLNISQNSSLSLKEES